MVRFLSKNATQKVQRGKRGKNQKPNTVGHGASYKEACSAGLMQGLLVFPPPSHKAGETCAKQKQGGREGYGGHIAVMHSPGYMGAAALGVHALETAAFLELEETCEVGI